MRMRVTRGHQCQSLILGPKLVRDMKASRTCLLQGTDGVVVMQGLSTSNLGEPQPTS